MAEGCSCSAARCTHAWGLAPVGACLRQLAGLARSPSMGKRAPNCYRRNTSDGPGLLEPLGPPLPGRAGGELDTQPLSTPAPSPDLGLMASPSPCPVPSPGAAPGGIRGRTTSAADSEDSQKKCSALRDTGPTGGASSRLGLSCCCCCCCCWG